MDEGRDRNGSVQREESGNGRHRAARAPVTALADTVSRLAEEIHAYHARAEARERVIDQLHAEIDRLRTGEQGLLLRPVITDLQKLRGELIRQAGALPAELGKEQVAELLESFALSVETALERCGCTAVRPEVGAEFSAREHRAVKLVPAPSPAEDETIAEVVADGYLDTRTNRIAVPAKVHVRRWRPPVSAIVGRAH